MGRVKKEIMAFETLLPNTMVIELPVCRNFIAYKENVRTVLEEEALRETNADILRDFDYLVSFKPQLRDGMATVGVDDVALVPVTLDADMKKLPYIYKITDWGDLKKTPLYGSREKIVTELTRRTKGKTIILNYRGRNEKCDFSSEMINAIFDSAEPKTEDVNIIPVGRGDAEYPLIGVTIFKNRL